MENKEITLGNGEKLVFSMITAMDALRFEDEFGADSMGESSMSDVRKALGIAWLANRNTREVPISFTEFCELIPFDDMPKITRTATLFLKTSSLETKPSSSLAEEST